MARMLVIGLDGATWTLLTPFMEQGLLPNLKRLLKQGAAGNLASTVPAHSGPAWTTFMTGVNPGKHGVFGFLHRTYGQTITLRPISSRDIQAPTIFQILSSAGRTVGSVNLPITYPPMDVNGFMISDDLMRPRGAARFTYPTDLLAQIGYEASAYNEGGIRLKVHDGQDDQLIDHCRRRVRVRLEVTQRLMARYDWDFLVVVFTETDRIQHLLWHALDPTHPNHNPSRAAQLAPALQAFYQEVDAAVGALLNQRDERTWVCVLSDHGFGPQTSHLLVNQVLARSGLLKMKSGRVRLYQRRLRGFLHQHSSAYRRLKTLVKRRQNGAGDRTAPETVRKLLGFSAFERAPIDWSKTTLYCLAEAGAGAHVNLQGREPCGIVKPGPEYERAREQALQSFGQLKHPQTGRPLPMKWYRKEELYHGPCTEIAPDLLCVNESDAKLNGQVKPDAANDFLPTTYTTGDHRSAGVFMLVGPEVKPGAHVTGGRILDIAPTILYLLGLPVPQHMDGRVLVDALNADYLRHHPIRTSEAMLQTRQEVRQDVYSAEEAAKIEQRLGDLGYLE